MTDAGDSQVNDAIARGVEAQQVILLANNHCSNMRFELFGGYSMVEQMTGLPISMRSVRCKHVDGQSNAGVHLAIAAVQFYTEHCVGCQLRNPNGQLPTLGALAAEHARAAAESQAAAQTAITMRRDEWRARASARQRLRLTANTAVDNLIQDLDLLDPEPGIESASKDRSDAKRRLDVVATRSPELFSDDAVTLLLEMVEAAPSARTLSPLRILAGSRPDIAPRIVSTALQRLSIVTDSDASRCITEFAEFIDSGMLNSQVLHSLVRLGGAAKQSDIGFLETDSAADPSALRIAASLVPAQVLDVLGEMLPSRSAPASLIMPPTKKDHNSDDRWLEYDRAAAADSIIALLETHPAVATATLPFLIRNLQIPGDTYEHHPVSRVVRAAAALVARDIDQLSDLEAAGAHGSDDYRSSLLDVVVAVARFVSPNDGKRHAGDDRLFAGDAGDLLDRVLPFILRLSSGVWGASLAADASRALHTLVEDHPAWSSTHVASLVGTLITLESRAAEPRTSPLLPLGKAPEAVIPGLGSMSAMEEYSLRSSYASAGYYLAKAIEDSAAGNPLRVVGAVLDAIQTERDTPILPNLLRRLIPVLGGVGAKHGEEKGLLRKVLHPLHAYLVDSDAGNRALALGAWTAISVQQPVPSTLVDLLPALLEDRHFVVIEKMMDATRKLQWDNDTRDRLLHYSLQAVGAVDITDHQELVVSAIWSALKLSNEHPLRESIQLLALGKSLGFDGRELEHIVDYKDWVPTAQSSTQMARARLKVAQYYFNYGQGGDEAARQLQRLLTTGPGLIGIAAATLTETALELGVDRVHPAAQFAEVPWRICDSHGAVTVLEGLLSSIPSDTAHRWSRWRAELLLSWARADAAAAAQEDFESHLRGVAQTAPDDDRGRDATVIEQLRLRLRVRCALLGRPMPSEWRLEDDTSTTAQSVRLESAAKDLLTQSVRDTDSAFLVRCVAELALIAAHLVEMRQAELDANIPGHAARRTAATLRLQALRREIDAAWGPTDPARIKLTDALARADDLNEIDIPAVLACWAALPLPLLLIPGPRPGRSYAVPAELAMEANSDDNVAVVLASINGSLITGPQALRPNTVYEISVEVRPGAWPDWATELEGEFLTDLSPAEIELPSFSWTRPFSAGPDSRLSQSGTLLCRFHLGAGQPAPRFRLDLRWRGTVDGRPHVQRLDVAAHREISLRPFDYTRDALTPSGPFDERLVDLFDRLRLAQYPELHVQAFGRLFTAICRAGLQMAWEKKYRKGTRVTEREFHDDLFQRLLDDPEIDKSLERGNPLALGFLDVRHDGITAELKVERRTPATEEHVTKYVAQPTQYASADGTRISILAILDLSPKAAPVGTPENYVFFLNPKLHGLEEPPLGSVVAVIVINGASPTPSSWSRRKAAVIEPDRAPSTDT